MKRNQNKGLCYYYSPDDSSPWNDVFEYTDLCYVTDLVLFTEDADNKRKIKLDISDCDTDWGGTIDGWLFPDWKFTGQFTYERKSGNNYKGIWTGTYELEDGWLILNGDIYELNELVAGFYIEYELSANNKTDNRSKNKGKKPISPLNKDNYKRLLKLAATIKNPRSNFDYYDIATKLALKPGTADDLYIAMSIAYSWMPTMLEVRVGKGKKLENYLPAVRYFSRSNRHDIFNEYDKAREHFTQITELVNNSVVGASKTLHLFYPAQVPIIDSNVVKGWNSFFKTDFTNFPKLKLPGYFSSASKEKQIDAYFDYWNMLNEWMRNTGIKNVREIEEAFYLIGREIKEI